MFLRESEGVYEFGSKRIMVKVERDKIQIKVGGGYLSIDEFLDQYTPVELEKLVSLADFFRPFLVDADVLTLAVSLGFHFRLRLRKCVSLRMLLW